jgi:hypothetical protein
MTDIATKYFKYINYHLGDIVSGEVVFKNDMNCVFISIGNSNWKIYPRAYFYHDTLKHKRYVKFKFKRDWKEI